MYYIIALIALILICIYCIFHKLSRYEGFDAEYNAQHDSWNNLDVGRKALDCYALNERDCMKYSNCGLCFKDGKKECIPGDEQGPLYKEGCRGWQHTNYYDRYIFGERVTTITPPWSHIYADYETVYPSRQIVQTL